MSIQVLSSEDSQSGRYRPARYVGRIGALAVALGVGGAIAAVPTVASADTGAGPDAGASSSAQASADSAESQTASPSQATRRGAGPRTSLAGPADNDSPAAEQSDASTASAADSAPARRAAAPTKRSSVQRGPSAPSASVAAPVAPAAPAPTVDVAEATAVAVAVDTPPAAVAPAAAEAPQLTVATAPGAVSGIGTALLTLLGGGTPGAPASAPLSWAVLSVSRRETEPAAAAAIASPASSVGDLAGNTVFLGALAQQAAQAISTLGLPSDVSTLAGQWPLQTPASVMVGEPNGDLRVVCDHPGHRSSEVVYRLPGSSLGGIGNSGTRVSVGVGGGTFGSTSGVGVSMGIGFPLGGVRQRYPSQLTVDLTPLGDAP